MDDHDELLLALAREMEEMATIFESSRHSDDIRRWADTLRAVAGSATPTPDPHAIYGFSGNVTRLSEDVAGSTTPPGDDDDCSDR